MRTRLGRCPQPPPPLVQLPSQRPEPLADRILVDHAIVIRQSRLYPCSSSGTGPKTARDAANRGEALARRQDELGQRLDALDAQVEDLAPAGDVSKLERRLGLAETDASAATEDADKASQKLTGLEERVSGIEDDAASTEDENGVEDPGAAEPPP